MIHPQRLDKYIASRECKKAQDSLLDMYSSLSKKQREDIKVMLFKNKNS